MQECNVLRISHRQSLEDEIKYKINDTAVATISLDVKTFDF